jgi:hypothetical protein
MMEYSKHVYTVCLKSLLFADADQHGDEAKRIFA